MRDDLRHNDVVRIDDSEADWIEEDIEPATVTPSSVRVHAQFSNNFGDLFDDDDISWRPSLVTPLCVCVCLYV